MAVFALCSVLPSAAGRRRLVCEERRPPSLGSARSRFESVSSPDEMQCDWAIVHLGLVHENGEPSQPETVWMPLGHKHILGRGWVHDLQAETVSASEHAAPQKIICTKKESWLHVIPAETRLAQLPGPMGRLLPTVFFRSASGFKIQANSHET
eukprot:244628-Rhodomonas_salina.1